MKREITWEIVTVADCLALESFDGTRVLAGENMLNKQVKKVSVLEATTTADIIKYHKGLNQVVLTSFLGLRGDAEGKRKVIATLAKVGVVALGLFNSEEIDEEQEKILIDEAKASKIILCKVPNKPGFGPGEAMTEIVGKLLFREEYSERASLVNRAIAHLFNFEKYDNFYEAVHGAALENDFQIVILNEEAVPVLRVETVHRLPLMEAVREIRGSAEVSQHSVCRFKSNIINNVKIFSGIIKISGKANTAIMVDNENAFSSKEAERLAEVIELSMSMWKFTPDMDWEAELMKAIRRGNVERAYRMAQEGGLGEPEILATFVTDCKVDIDSDMLRRYVDGEIVLLDRGDWQQGLIYSKGKGGVVEAGCLDFFNHLREKSEGSGGHIFFVTGVQTIGDSIRNYKLIDSTIKSGKVIFPRKRVFSKFDMAFISNCIAIAKNREDEYMGYVNLISTMVGTGDMKRETLLNTIETFLLDGDGDVNTTKGIMKVHANTITYRLKGISKLTGLDLSDSNCVSGMVMALALRRLQTVEE